MTKAYSYLRFSTPEQMQGDSFRRQTQLALDYCAQKNLMLDTEVTWHDLGVSAFRGKNAEAGRLGEFLQAVKEGLIEDGSVLLVESLDRISRQAARRALRVLEAICDEGITVVTLSDGKAYTREALDADPMSLIMSLLVFIRANEESAMKSKRLKAAWVGKRKKVAEGKKLTAQCPGWLRLDKEAQQWVVLEDRAAVVRRIYRDIAAGQSTYTVSESLNRDKVPVFGPGQMWHRSYVRKLLDDNPAVVGTYVPHVTEYIDGKKTYKPLDPIPGYFPAIVPDDLYQQVRTVRQGNRGPLRAGRAYNIFSGLVRCSRCGGSMTLQTKGPRYLVCNKARYGAGCRYTAVRYDQVEGFFLLASEGILGSAPAGDEGARGQLEDIEAALEALEHRREPLVVGYERTHDTTMLDRLNEVNAEIESLQERKADLRARIEASSSGWVSNRTRDLQELLKAGVKNLDRPATALATRALFSGLSLNPDTGIATLGWRHGGTSQFTFAWPEGAPEAA